MLPCTRPPDHFLGKEFYKMFSPGNSSRHPGQPGNPMVSGRSVTTIWNRREKYMPHKRARRSGVDRHVCNVKATGSNPVESIVFSQFFYLINSSLFSKLPMFDEGMAGTRHNTCRHPRWGPHRRNCIILFKKSQVNGGIHPFLLQSMFRSHARDLQGCRQISIHPVKELVL